jgi:hypothetical protein
MDAAKHISWIDRLFDWLFHWLDAPLIKQAAGEVSRECRSAVWRQVCEATKGMGRPEVRGYIRAIVPELVDDEVDAVLNRRRIGLNLRPQIIAEAVEQLIDVGVSDVVCARPPRIAAPAGRARAA